jgi:hypothetical protein
LFGIIRLTVKKVRVLHTGTTAVTGIAKFNLDFIASMDLSIAIVVVRFRFLAAARCRKGFIHGI